MAKKQSKSKTKKSAIKRPSTKGSTKRSAKRSTKRPMKRSANRSRATRARRPARAASRAVAPAADVPLSALEERLIAAHREYRGGKYATELLGEYCAAHVAAAYDRLVQRRLLRRHPTG